MGIRWEIGCEKGGNKVGGFFNEVLGVYRAGIRWEKGMSKHPKLGVSSHLFPPNVYLLK